MATPAFHPQRDADGRLILRGVGVPPLLADFFETDIGLYQSRADDMIAALAAPPEQEARFFGNLYEARVMVATVEIVNLFDETQRLSVPRADFARALTLWRAALLG